MIQRYECVQRKSTDINQQLTKFQKLSALTNKVNETLKPNKVVIKAKILPSLIEHNKSTLPSLRGLSIPD